MLGLGAISVAGNHYTKKNKNTTTNIIQILIYNICVDILYEISEQIM